MNQPSPDKNSKVALFYEPSLIQYPETPPFDPSDRFPENPSEEHIQTQPNPIYDAVRGILEKLDLDKEHQGTTLWNPLGDLISSGGTVVLKPNLVDVKQGWIALGGERILDMVTHGSVLRPLIDYAYRAVGSGGKIIICDAPLVHADFNAVVEGAGIRAMVEQLKTRGIPISLLDLREEFFARWTNERQELPGDPLGNSVFDFGSRSALAPLDTSPQKYFTLADHTDERNEPQRYHYKDHHEYCIPNTILSSGLFINVPKLKTHIKTGVTLSLKNLMGITHYRRWMPHHRSGAPPEGDEYPFDPGVVLRKRHSIVQKIAQYPLGTTFIRSGAYIRHFAARAIGRKDRTVIDGGWYGNDTLWRTLVDLNRVLFYGRPGGKFVSTRRSYLSLVDGVIAGEGNGPVKPTTRPTGMLAASLDAVALDSVLAWAMGYDPARIRTIQGTASSEEPFWLGLSDLERIEVVSNIADWRTLNLSFQEPLGWEGYLKRDIPISQEMQQRLDQMKSIG